jgi:hypothetical protein
LAGLLDRRHEIIAVTVACRARAAATRSALPSTAMTRAESRVSSAAMSPAPPPSRRPAERPTREAQRTPAATRASRSDVNNLRQAHHILRARIRAGQTSILGPRRLRRSEVQHARVALLQICEVVWRTVGKPQTEMIRAGILRWLESHNRRDNEDAIAVHTDFCSLDALMTVSWFRLLYRRRLRTS